jgi:hypothetical protein
MAAPNATATRALLDGLSNCVRRGCCDIYTLHPSCFWIPQKLKTIHFSKTLEKLLGVPCTCVRSGKKKNIEFTNISLCIQRVGGGGCLAAQRHDKVSVKSSHGSDSNRNRFDGAIHSHPLLALLIIIRSSCLVS